MHTPILPFPLPGSHPRAKVGSDSPESLPPMSRQTAPDLTTVRSVADGSSVATTPLHIAHIRVLNERTAIETTSPGGGPPPPNHTVAPIVALRSFARQKGADMPYKTPRTSNVVALISDARYRARVAFMADGHLCEETEVPVLAALRDALYEAQEADNQRIEAVYVLNFGAEEAPSYTHARRRRELEQLRNADVPA